MNVIILRKMRLLKVESPFSNLGEYIAPRYIADKIAEAIGAWLPDRRGVGVASCKQ
jgi:hypothetical protein